jgi:predicted nucleic acid-binding Zn ribbon protein
MNRGRWAVQRERCRLEGSEPRAGLRDPKPLGEAMAGILKSLGLEGDAWLSDLENDWTSVAGAAVARHARPGRVENRVLTVYVDSSVWLSELSRFGRGPLMENIRKRFGSDRVASVAFRLDPDQK